MADVDEAGLASAESELKTAGGTVLVVRTDVSKRSDVELLARRALEAFGQVHLLFNNVASLLVEPRGKQPGTIGSG